MRRSALAFLFALMFAVPVPAAVDCEPYDPVLIPDGVEISERILDRLAGNYRLMDSVLQVSVEDGRLWVTDSEHERSEAIPQNERTYFLRDSNVLLHFQLTDDGDVERMILRQGERAIPCPPVK